MRDSLHCLAQLSFAGVISHLQPELLCLVLLVPTLPLCPETWTCPLVMCTLLAGCSKEEEPLKSQYQASQSAGGVALVLVFSDTLVVGSLPVNEYQTHGKGLYSSWEQLPSGVRWLWE